MATVVLAGCQPEPLAAYLKALGVLRLVAEQADPAATGHWTGEGFVLDSTLDEAGLVEFFTSRYEPTPIVSPWNGGSGFHEKDNKSGIEALERSDDPRLAVYRATIAAARNVLASVGPGADKATLVRVCRSRLPDAAVRWLDAAVVLLDDDLGFPPLLGTGGNDGRLDFSNNYLQRIALLFGLTTGKRAGPAPADWFRGALTGSRVAAIKAGIGQFDPGAAGGPGSASTGALTSLVNPADFVLLLEGAMVMAAGPARRLGTGTDKWAAMPFTLGASPIGYASAVDGEDTSELWLPLWVQPATYAEIARLFAEGRCRWSGRQARSGLDAARAAMTLGVDRGIGSFSRMVLATRNGQNTTAVPAGRILVVERPEVAVLGDLDRWLSRVKTAKNPPNNVVAGRHRVERAMFAAADGTPGAGLDVLVAAGALDRTVGTATTFREGVDPLRLDGGRWRRVLADAMEASADPAALRVAIGLTSLHNTAVAHVGALLRPVRAEGRSLRWADRPAVGGLGRGALLPVLAELHRRLALGALLDDEQPAVAEGMWVPFGDVVRLATGDLDLTAVEDLLCGLLLFDPKLALPPRSPATSDPTPCPALGLLAPSFGDLPEGVTAPDRRDVLSWVTRLASPTVEAAADVLSAAGRRLGIAGWHVRAAPAAVSRGAPPGPSLAAALLLSMSPSDRLRLARQAADPPPASTIRPAATATQGA